jgi:pyruvate kinase
VEIIADLIVSGMSVARVNMSHGTHQGHAQLIDSVRKASNLVGLEVAILLDLQGPKIRVGELPGVLTLKKGETWVIGPTGAQNNYPEYQKCFIPTTYERLVEDCEDGVRILFNDGLIVTETVERDRDVYKIQVLVGGNLTSHKGINLPDTKISVPCITAKDRRDIAFAVEHRVDYLALSFVREKGDVQDLKKVLADLDSNLPIVSKIENQKAVENIEEIIQVSDVVMVARGDMGVELGNHMVPSVQKRIIALCNQLGVPVITATQMLESMVDNPTPTRAEASDVANAIWDGTDAVMLSGETASGSYPVGVVKVMSDIIREAEKTPKVRMSLKYLDLSRIDDATMIGASLIAEKIGARRIVAVTETGSSCLKMSRYRPRTSVLGVSNGLSAVRKMCLYWGVSPFYLDKYDEDDSQLEAFVIEKVRNACELAPGDRIVITRGSGKFFARGTANSIKVVTLE